MNKRIASEEKEETGLPRVYGGGRGKVTTFSG